MVRRRLGLSRTESRFPEKGTCLDIYSRAVNACEPLETVLTSSFPTWIGWAAELKGLFAGYVEAKQRVQVLDYDDLCSTGPKRSPTPRRPAHSGAIRPVIVDEYQDTNRLQAEILLGCAGRERHGGRRRRPVDLRLPRRRLP